VPYASPPVFAYTTTRLPGSVGVRGYVGLLQTLGPASCLRASSVSGEALPARSSGDALVHPAMAIALASERRERAFVKLFRCMGLRV
jgi:hypothetical protein